MPVDPFGAVDRGENLKRVLSDDLEKLCNEFAADRPNLGRIETEAKAFTAESILKFGNVLAAAGLASELAERAERTTSSDNPKQIAHSVAVQLVAAAAAGDSEAVASLLARVPRWPDVESFLPREWANAVKSTGLSERWADKWVEKLESILDSAEFAINELHDQLHRFDPSVRDVLESIIMHRSNRLDEQRRRGKASIHVHELMPPSIPPAVAIASHAPYPPVWEADKRTLKFGGFEKRYKQPAANQVPLLEAFQAAGWPARIQVPPSLSTQRPSDLASNLNKSLGNDSPIVFFADGTGEGVRWEVALGKSKKRAATSSYGRATYAILVNWPS